MSDERPISRISSASFRKRTCIGSSWWVTVMVGWSSPAWWMLCRSALLTWSSLYTFVPRDGESMVDVSPIVNYLVRKQVQADGWRVDPPKERSLGVTTEPDRSMVRRSMTPQPLKTLEQPLHLKNPAIVEAVPRTHIECTSGGFFFLFMRRILARRALPPTEAGWRLRQLPTGHDAMITMPRELADVLLEVV